MSTSNGHFGFGSPATPEQIAGWDIDVASDGTGLPAGSGTVPEGKEIYDRLGAKCHGPLGEGGEGGPPLVGGIGTLNTDAPLKTVGSFWPYAPVLYDYIHRAMPADNPQSLAPDEVYALCAYLLVSERHRAGGCGDGCANTAASSHAQPRWLHQSRPASRCLQCRRWQRPPSLCQRRNGFCVRKAGEMICPASLTSIGSWLQAWSCLIASHRNRNCKGVPRVLEEYLTAFSRKLRRS